MEEEMAEVHEIVLPISWTETERTGHSFGVGTMLGHSFKLFTNARPLFLGGEEQGLVERGGTDSASTTDGALDLPPGNAGCVSPASIEVLESATTDKFSELIDYIAFSDYRR
ncbi:hypothetical protein MRX96_003273 [Rhipicephalus microplus]